nr:MAG: hypothetical protein [Bacteriophage sp.]
MAKFIGVKMIEATPMRASMALVKPENFDLNVGANYAQIKAEDKIWEGLGFVLQWAKYGLKR